MISITDKGAEKVHEFLADQQADVSVAGLRVGVRGGGCSGFQYQLAFDEQRESDIVFESHGLKLLVDGEALRTSRARSSTTRKACRARASRSRTPTSSQHAGAAPPSAWRKRSRSPRSDRGRSRALARAAPLGILGHRSAARSLARARVHGVRIPRAPTPSPRALTGVGWPASKLCSAQRPEQRVAEGLTAGGDLC